MPRLLRARLIFLLALTALAPITTAGTRFFLQLGGGLDRTAATRIVDVRCSSTAPPALFGCVTGSDGEPLSARGRFTRHGAFEATAGVEVTSQLRLGLLFIERPLGLSADANFPGVAQPQPVSGQGRSLAALLSAAITLGRPSAALRPFVTLAAGGARNSIGTITYHFPAIDPSAVTVVRGGAHSEPVWCASAGLTLRMGDRVEIDGAYRYAMLGQIETAPGTARIVRPTRQLTLDIAGTSAPLQLSGPTITVRVRF